MKRADLIDLIAVVAVVAVVAVATHRSFRKAAAELNMSAPALVNLLDDARAA